jgi:hypothetical protein
LSFPLLLWVFPAELSARLIGECSPVGEEFAVRTNRSVLKSGTEEAWGEDATEEFLMSTTDGEYCLTSDDKKARDDDTAGEEEEDNTTEGEEDCSEMARFKAAVLLPGGSWNEAGNAAEAAELVSVGLSFFFKDRSFGWSWSLSS